MLTMHWLRVVAVFLFGFALGGTTVKLIDEHENQESQPAPAITISGEIGAGVGP